MHSQKLESLHQKQDCNHASQARCQGRTASQAWAQPLGADSSAVVLNHLLHLGLMFELLCSGPPGMVRDVKAHCANMNMATQRSPHLNCVVDSFVL